MNSRLLRHSDQFSQFSDVRTGSRELENYIYKGRIKEQFKIAICLECYCLEVFPAESRCWHVVVLYTGMSEAMLGDVALVESIRPSADAWEKLFAIFCW